MSDLVERLRKEIKFSLPRNTVHIDLLGEAATRIEALEAECFALAANQCHAGYGDDYGNHRCARIEALEAALRELLELHDVDHQTDNDAAIVNFIRAVLDKDASK